MIILLTASSPSLAADAPFFATIEGITANNGLIATVDGDRKVQIVLAFLVIPYGEMPYAKRASEILRAQLVGRRVSVRPIGTPRGNYVSGIVYVGENNFNLDFLSRGHAWVDVYQVSHPSWVTAGNVAKDARIGLYADPNAVHPMEYEIEKSKAANITAMTQALKPGPELDRALNTTFVGHRHRKVYVQTNCIEVWSTWPANQHTIILTKAGADDDGFTFLECASKEEIVQNE
ncbi:MAG: thermonuclease family protein [Candidatus Devosia euplotis]|nr:thermonuclease family protein [Candidatus Devosia euplotis]